MKPMAKGRKAQPRARTLREVQAWGRAGWRVDRPAKPHRQLIGYIRCFIGTHYFAGCYMGAEND